MIFSTRFLSKTFKIKICTTIVLPVVLYGWSMVSYIKGGMQAKGIWKQEPEANIWAQEGCEWWVEKASQSGTSYFVPFIARVITSRRLIWAGHVARMEEGRSAFKMLTGTPAGKRTLRRPRRWWEDNIRVDLKEIYINEMNIGEPLWMRHLTSGIHKPWS